MREYNNSRRRNAHEKIKYECPCGQVVTGNGKFHQRTCAVHLRERGWPMEARMHDALREHYAGKVGVAGLIGNIERRLGQIYLARRESGNLDEMRWIEYRDLVWQLAEEEAGRV
jgi:hypothetical protein